MTELLLAIAKTGLTKQKFADMTKIPYYRVAVILYGNDCLREEEKKRIKKVFGKNIFLPLTTQNV